MIQRRTILGTLAMLALFGASSASADALKPTGDVDKDFTGTGTVTIPGHSPDAVFQAPWITQQGWINGWVIKDVRLNYDKGLDNLVVGVNFWGIAGDADGNGLPGVADPRTTAAGGREFPHLGSPESIAVAFDLNKDKKFDIIAGVPASQASRGPGIDGYNLTNYVPSSQGIENNFGSSPLAGHMGGLVFDPDKAHPDFEFVLTHFSTLPGLDLSKGFGLQAYAGSPSDVVTGEDSIPYTLVGSLSPETIHIPEPATMLAWSLVAGGAAWRLRKRNRAVG